MCTFCKTSELPTHTGSKGNGKNSFISYFLKPNKENEQYRLRLLFYRNEKKNDRKDAFIVQKIHDHWGVSKNGSNVVDDFIICPSTDYVHYDEDKFVLNPKTNKKEVNCPICAKSRENFSAYMNSGKSDKLSLKKAFQLKCKERLCAPVYVIKDPNNPKNDGTLKVLILTNQDDIKLFKKTVEDEKTKSYLASKSGAGYEVFNGGNAVDLYIRVESVPEVRNQGKQNEYVSNVRKITQIAFGKKTQQISAINSEAVSSFEFDDQFYFSNTKQELEEFYKKYYGQNDIMPDEEDVFGATDQSINTDVLPQPEVHTQNDNIEPANVDIEGLDSIASDDELKPDPPGVDECEIDDEQHNDNDDLESYINELDV